MRVDEGLVVVVFAFGQNCKAAAFPCMCSVSTSVSVFLHFMAGLCFLVIPLSISAFFGVAHFCLAWPLARRALCC